MRIRLIAAISALAAVGLGDVGFRIAAAGAPGDAPAIQAPPAATAGSDAVARVHHTNMDTVERVPAADLVQNAAIVAAFAHRAANHDGLLPRKPAAAPGGK